MSQSQIITFPFTESFVDRFADHLEQNYFHQERDLSRYAIIFGGKRPALFLRRELAKRLNKSFFSPQFFTIDEFISLCASKVGDFESSDYLDHCYTLYLLAKEKTPQILKSRDTFAQFLPWAREILAFIDQLDLESVPNDCLKTIQSTAEIGYDIPEDINRLLQHIVILRHAFHMHMEKTKQFSRGFQYYKAAEGIDSIEFQQFDHLFFGNFFYLHKTEEKVLHSLYQRKHSSLVFQGDQRRWPVFERAAKLFGVDIKEGAQPYAPQFDLHLYEGFDVHSQVGLVRSILKTIDKKDQTVIVLPQPDMLVPLMTEIGGMIENFNISMGYPLKRSSFYSLLDFLFQAQTSRKGSLIYTKDYLKVLRHPFLKNLRLHESGTVTRVLIHKLEEVLTGQVLSENLAEIVGCAFIDCDSIEQSTHLFTLVRQTLNAMGEDVSEEDLFNILHQIHTLCFRQWEGLQTFFGLSQCLQNFITVMREQSFLQQYPLNVKIAHKLYEIAVELRQASFQQEIFPQEEMFRILKDRIDQEIVAFVGSPLRGLQILGLFETRSLNFDQVIVCDVNEGVLPYLKIYEPLIPREVMISLNLDRLELEEEIQRYQFMRLISSAKNVHLVYCQAKDKQRSRFVEELIWNEEQKKKEINSVPIERGAFNVKIQQKRIEIPKTPEMIEHLKTMRYSASSVNTYLRNPLEFYYAYVLRLREKEDLLDEPENRQIGIFLHDFLEDSFRKFLNQNLQIDAGFAKKFFDQLDYRFEQSFGRSHQNDAYLMKTVLESRMRRFLEQEADGIKRPVEKILFLEEAFVDKVTLESGSFDFVYKVDRVDEMKDGTILILDYKTGSINPSPKRFDRMKTPPANLAAMQTDIRSFQMPLYFNYLQKNYPDRPINAAFYNLRTMKLDYFISPKELQRREEIVEFYQASLSVLMDEILDENVPFLDLS